MEQNRATPRQIPVPQSQPTAPRQRRPFQIAKVTELGGLDTLTLMFQDSFGGGI